MKFKIGDIVFAKNRSDLGFTDALLMGHHGIVQGYYTNNHRETKYLVKYSLVFVKNEGLTLHGGQLFSLEENYVGKHSDNNDCWWWSEVDLALVPTTKSIMEVKDVNSNRKSKIPESVFAKYEIHPVYKDLQGTELHLGDTVLIMSKTNPIYNGWSGKVTAFDGKLVVVTLAASGTTVFRPKDTVIIPANSFLPANVSITTYTCYPNEINVTLWNNKGEIVTDATAKCSPSDKFDFFYGLYKIALPRLFGCKTKEII